MSRFRFRRMLLSLVLWMVARPKTTLGIVAAFVIGSGILAFSKLTVSTDQDELFSSDVPFFRHYIDFTKQFPENQANYVILEAKDAAHPPTTARWAETANAIADALAKHPEWVRSVHSHTDVQQLGTAGLLLDDPDSVHKNFDDITQLAGAWAPSGWKNPKRFFGNTPTQRFVGKIARAIPDADQAQFLTMIADGWTKSLADPKKPVTLGNQVPNLAELGVSSPRDLGYDFIPDETDSKRMMLLIPVFEQDYYNQRNGMAETIDGIKGIIAETAKKYPEFEIGMSGRPTLEADEMKTTDTDARWSEIAALSAVFIGLVILLRSIWLAIAAEIALLIGIALTFGWATLAVGRLNLLSMVFLIALTGIGMDYLVQVLTRYRRESARRSDPRAIWTGVFRYVAAPINTACLGASGAFLVSIFTNFRGAAELGIIAGGGLLLCLLTGYVVIPPLLTLFPAKPREEDNDRWVEPALGNGSQPLTGWRRHKWLVLPFVWAILLLAAIPEARKSQFNPSLLQMQAQGLPSVQLIRKLPTWSAVVLSKDVDQLKAARTAVALLPTVKNTDSLLQAYDNYDWLTDRKLLVPNLQNGNYEPVAETDLADLATSIDHLAASYKPGFPGAAAAMMRSSAAIRATPPDVAAARMSDWQAVFIGQLRTLLLPFTPGPFDPHKLPPAIRDHYIGTNGDFALYINPKEDLWDQPALGRFVVSVEKAVAKSPVKATPVTGIAVNVWHSTSSIEHSFHKATAYALALIFFLVLIDLRNIPQTLLAISVLAMGLPMLVALMGFFHIDWNFANFFGLPILIGAGHEYGVFMVHRYNEACADPHRAWRKWDVSDKALLSCAYVTTASFGFFWLLGHHEGLKSLGLVMALGTACIYLATLCMLRPLLLWKLARREQCGVDRGPE